MPSEFDLIRRHFTRPARHTDLAVGDDAALLHARPGMQLAVSTDMLVAGTHFFADTDPEDLGWKTLAVNVSDLAAMGASPRWAFLALALPAADEAWIAAFARGFFACAGAHDIAASDYVRAVPDLIRPWIADKYVTLGTDGFGRSDTRENLRRFFEVDRHAIAVAALHALGDSRVGEAISRYGIDAEGEPPWRK